ncbi:wax ester/triacylglycerol synthase family O-acyltransferase [Marinobacteraceae bacterium S3BR75-40.1]
MRQLSELDASFLYLETETTPMHIGGLYIFDRGNREQPVSFQEFTDFLRSRLHLATFFRQKLLRVPLGLDRPYWMDDAEFELERHIEHLPLKGPCNDQDLTRLAAQRLEQPLPLDRPLWHITFIDGLGEDLGVTGGSFALIVKIHHAAIDPFSGEEVMGTLLQYSPEMQPLAPAPRWVPEPEPSRSRVFMQAYANAVQKPFRLANMARDAAASALHRTLLQHIGRRNLPPSLFNAPRTPFNRNVTGRRQLLTHTVKLARLKEIKSQIGEVTLNDVVLGLCAELLNRYLEQTDHRAERPLITLTPISVRSKSLRRPTGNQMSAMQLSLATDEPNPARRVKLIHRNARISETYQQAIAADRLTELIPSTMLALSARLYSEFQLAQRYQPMFNVPITNVPGPQVPLYLQGAQLVRQLNFSPLFDGVGLVIVAMSYEGELTLNFTLCPEVIPDADRLTALVDESLDALEAAARQLPYEESGNEEALEAPTEAPLLDDTFTLFEGLLDRVLNVARLKSEEKEKDRETE